MRYPAATGAGAWQGLRLFAQIRVVLQQGHHGATQQQPQLLGQAQAFRLTVRRMLFDGADVLVDQLPHRAPVARPIGTGLRRLQAVAHVTQFAGQGGHAVGEGGQQRFRRVGAGEQLLQRHATTALQYHAVAQPIVHHRAHACRRPKGGTGGRAVVGLVRHGANPGAGRDWFQHIGAVADGLNG